MRRAARVDVNQRDIVEALRCVGASVQPLSAVGQGVPDLLVGWRGKNFLLEVKDGHAIPSKRKLTDNQADWHARWSGEVAVVLTPDEALRAIGVVFGASPRV